MSKSDITSAIHCPRYNSRRSGMFQLALRHLMLCLRWGLQGDLTQMVDIEVAGEMETLKNTVRNVLGIILC